MGLVYQGYIEGKYLLIKKILMVDALFESCILAPIDGGN